jgi:hypothetical protein
LKINSLASRPSRASGAIFQYIHAAVSDYHRWRIEKEILPKYILIPRDLENEETKGLVRDAFASYSAVTVHATQRRLMC